MAAMEKQLRENDKAVEEMLETEITIPKPNDKANGPKPEKEPKSSSITVPVMKQKLGSCERCGYMSSQKLCQACMLLEGLNKNRPEIQI